MAGRKVAGFTAIVYTAWAMKVVSIQSAVVWGHVGNSAAVFPLQRLGVEVWPIDTVQFSNHPGYGRWNGQVFSALHVRELVDGIDAVGALAECDGVLSGYLGDPGSAAAVALAVERVKEANPDALYLCDPVMGDEGTGLYVRPGIPEAIRDTLLPLADIVTPNRFELAHLTGMADSHPLEAARALLARGPRAVIVTSLPDSEGIACLAVTEDGAWRVRTPLLPFDPPVNGAGDLLAALLLGHILGGAEIPQAMSLAVSGLFAVLEATLSLGRRELALVQAQERLVVPPRIFAAHAVR